MNGQNDVKDPDFELMLWQLSLMCFELSLCELLSKVSKWSSNQ